MKPIKASFISVNGTELTDEEKYLIEKENPLGIALFGRNIESPAQLKKLTSSLKEVAGRNDLLIATDQEGGRVCRLAPPHWRQYLAQSVIGDLKPNQAKIVSQLHAELIAYDFHKVGLNCNFAPTLDIKAPLITKALKSRCFSRNPQMTALLGRIMFDAYNKSSILPCIKHIPGHAGAHNDPHLQLSVIRRAPKHYLYPFEQIVPHALMAMSAHIVFSNIDSLPITMSKKAISSLVRGQLGFKGMLISDALEMKALSGTLSEKTTMAIQAGCSAVCYCKGDMNGLQEVLDHCGYLSDESMMTFEKISYLIQKKYTIKNISEKARKYNTVVRSLPPLVDDYDAVEVLMKL